VQLRRRQATGIYVRGTVVCRRLGQYQQTNCLFIPDYSSQSPSGAAAEPNVDDLLSWNAWPTGPSDLDNSTDIQYLKALAGKPYMMPVSPGSTPNLPSKNWLWRGDDLWHQRWDEVMNLQPKLVEILT
jgi:hypothetical protein